MKLFQLQISFIHIFNNSSHFNSFWFAFEERDFSICLLCQETFTKIKWIIWYMVLLLQLTENIEKYLADVMLMTICCDFVKILLQRFKAQTGGLNIWKSSTRRRNSTKFAFFKAWQWQTSRTWTRLSHLSAWDKSVTNFTILNKCSLALHWAWSFLHLLYCVSFLWLPGESSCDGWWCYLWCSSHWYLWYS